MCFLWSSNTSLTSFWRIRSSTASTRNRTQPQIRTIVKTLFRISRKSGLSTRLDSSPFQFPLQSVRQVTWRFSWLEIQFIVLEKIKGFKSKSKIHLYMLTADEESYWTWFLLLTISGSEVLEPFLRCFTRSETLLFPPNEWNLWKIKLDYIRTVFLKVQTYCSHSSTFLINFSFSKHTISWSRIIMSLTVINS